MSEQIIEAEIVEPGTEMVTADSHGADTTLFGTSDPLDALAAMTKTANALAPVLRQQNMTANIHGKDHVEIAGWQTLGAMLGVTPVGCWTRKIEGGWEAKVNAQTLDGRVVGSAEAMCVRKEDRWKDAEDYAIRSMAQTRAASKALASVLRFVVTLAGFSGTPAEEMDGVKPSGSRGPSAKQLTFLDKLIGEKYKDADASLVRGLVSAMTGAQVSKAIGGLKDDDAAMTEELLLLARDRAAKTSEVPADTDGLDPDDEKLANEMGF